MPREVTIDMNAEVLRKAFDQVCDPNDWRGPIDALVPLTSSDIYVQAVEFMTATKPTLKLSGHYGSDGHLMLRLQSVGYRAGPAGDH